MALINCPSCGNMISEKAIKCPKCGYSVSENLVTYGGIKEEEDRREETKNTEASKVQEDTGESMIAGKSSPILSAEKSKYNKSSWPQNVIAIAAMIVACICMIVTVSNTMTLNRLADKLDQKETMTGVENSLSNSEYEEVGVIKAVSGETITSDQGNTDTVENILGNKQGTIEQAESVGETEKTKVDNDNPEDIPVTYDSIIMGERSVKIQVDRTYWATTDYGRQLIVELTIADVGTLSTVDISIVGLVCEIRDEMGKMLYSRNAKLNSVSQSNLGYSYTIKIDFSDSEVDWDKVNMIKLANYV